MLNEKGVGIGESTCGCVDWEALLNKTIRKNALIGIEELTRLGLERGATAIEAIEFMGDLATMFGFVPEDNFEGTGESLLVIDPTSAWVFHVLQDPTYSSAIWAAQRVADDSFAVVANMFIIREIDLNDPVNFMFSENMVSIAASTGLWKKGDPFDFTRIYSSGEYGHKYYSGRRWACTS